MLVMQNECTVISSVKVKLTFDNGTIKEKIISTDDLVDVEYNANGLRKHITGRVVKVSTVGTDPKGWYIVIDGSDDFEADKARFSPMSILDIDILRKADAVEIIQSPIDETGIPFMRVKNGYLQYSRDGIRWKMFRNNPDHHKPAHDPDDEDFRPEPHHHHHDEPHHPEHYVEIEDDDDEIEDAVY